MYAIVKTGGKQYRVQQGESLLVERLPADDGATVTLQPLLYVDGDNVVDGEDIGQVTVEARIVAHERGPKLRVVKFKPKRGYKRRNGHRQDLSRIEITSLQLGAGGSPGGAQAASTTPGGEAASTTAGGQAAPTTPGAQAAPTTSDEPATAEASDGA
ncbi:MAG: 50S ribosomal protein L21 [Solirubrobacteraceae bacterium]